MQQCVWQKDLLGVMHYVKDALAVLTDIILDTDDMLDLDGDGQGCE